MPLCAHISKSFSFRCFRLQEYLRQQESTSSCERMVCSMITINENVTLLPVEMICGAIARSKSGRDSHFFTSDL